MMTGDSDGQMIDGPQLQADGSIVSALTTSPVVLDTILDMLPVGITVQDANGKFIVINETALTQLDSSALVERHAIAGTIIDGGQIVETEEQCTSLESRVLLTLHRPAHIAGERLMLSTSFDITDRKTAEQDLHRRADFDALTGLPKSSAVERRANTTCQASDTPFALAFFDIDNFKHINDYYGHAAGDALLVKVAERLRAELGVNDLLTRISGDEFLLLLDSIHSHDQLTDRIERLSERLRAPYFIDGFEVFASASIGVSIFPDHGDTFDILRHHADIAMYRAKGKAKGSYAIFDAEMEREATERSALERRLRLAIMDKRFVCAFQPKVDIRTREIHGVEALVRLCDENGEIQAPGTFVDLAIQLGLIDELTHLVVEQVAASLDLIDAEFGETVSISINVAARQAGDVAFMRSLIDALRATGCANRFMIEVTEDAVLSKAHFQQKILPLLRELGVGVSIDDFGTGFSSLSALADIVADEVKIDRSFITDIHKRPRSQSVLHAIESLSASLGMTVIAEGVETYEELAYLQAATNIRYAQGYYFSRPLLLEEFQVGTGHADANRLVESARLSRNDRKQQNRARGIGR